MSLVRLGAFLVSVFFLLSVTAEQSEKQLQNLATAIVEMLSVCFVQAKHRRMFNFYAHAASQETGISDLYYFGAIIDATLQQLWHNSSEPIATRLGLDQMLPVDIERHYTLLLVDSCAALRFLYDKLFEYHLHIGGFFIILLSNAEDLLPVFELNWHAGIINVNVLIQELPQQILLYTAMPFEKERCFNFEPHIANRYELGRWQNGNTVEDFYPGKLVNFYGCSLRCAARSEMPYIKLLEQQDSKQLATLVGLEGKLLEYLSERLNFTLQFQWLNEQEILQSLDENGGLFHRLFSTGTDFAIGAFRYRHTQELDPYVFSTTYFLSTLRFVISSRTTPFSPFAKLLLPFALDVWCSLASCCLISLLIFRCLRLRRFQRWRYLLLGAHNPYPFYNMLVLGLGGTVTTVPAPNLARYLLILWLVMAIVLRSAYQALLYHFIRMDVQVPPPEQVDQLLALNVTLLMSPSVYDSVKQLRHINRRAQVIYTPSLGNFELLRSAQQQRALLIGSEIYRHFRLSYPKKVRDYHMVHEGLLTQPLVIYMRRNFYMLQRINRYINEYVNSGLMSRWVRIFVDPLYMERTSRQSMEEQPQPMNMMQLHGALRLLLLGYAFSLCVLLWEIGRYGMQRLWHLLTLCIRNAFQGPTYHI